MDESDNSQQFDGEPVMLTKEQIEASERAAHHEGDKDEFPLIPEFEEEIN